MCHYLPMKYYVGKSWISLWQIDVKNNLQKQTLIGFESLGIDYVNLLNGSIDYHTGMIILGAVYHPSSLLTF